MSSLRVSRSRGLWWVALLASCSKQPEAKPQETKPAPEIVALRDEMCACQDSDCIHRVEARERDWERANPSREGPSWQVAVDVGRCELDAQIRVANKPIDLKAMTQKLAAVPPCMADLAAAIKRMPADTWTRDDELKPASLDVLRGAIGVDYIASLGGLRPYTDSYLGERQLAVQPSCAPGDHPAQLPLTLAMVHVSACQETSAGVHHSPHGDTEVFRAGCHEAYVWIDPAKPAVIGRLAVSLDAVPKKPIQDLSDAEAYKLAHQHALDEVTKETAKQLGDKLLHW